MKFDYFRKQNKIITRLASLFVLGILSIIPISVTGVELNKSETPVMENHPQELLKLAVVIIH